MEGGYYKKKSTLLGYDPDTKKKVWDIQKVFYPTPARWAWATLCFHANKGLVYYIKNEQEDIYFPHGRPEGFIEPLQFLQLNTRLKIFFGAKDGIIADDYQLMSILRKYKKDSPYLERIAILNKFYLYEKVWGKPLPEGEERLQILKQLKDGKC